MKEIGKLPNPDPSDTDPWDREAEARQVITVDPTYEASRGDLRRQAQEWAQLDVDPNAELFVFVGRWSNQKVCFSLLSFKVSNANKLLSRVLI